MKHKSASDMYVMERGRMVGNLSTAKAASKKMPMPKAAEMKHSARNKLGAIGTVKKVRA